MDAVADNNMVQNMQVQGNDDVVLFMHSMHIG